MDSKSISIKTRSKSVIESTPKIKEVLTEDLGKTMEYAICQVIDTPFIGKFKYSLEKANKLAERLEFMKELFKGYVHVGATDNLNDFEKEEPGSSETLTQGVKLLHLSVKTTKKKNEWKICPQLIGQPTRFTFCQRFGLDNPNPTGSEETKVLKAVLSDSNIKDYIVTNISDMMKEYIKTTFHCPVLFYNEGSDLIWLITMIAPIDWKSTEFSFSHLEKNKSWNESTTLYLRTESSKSSKLVSLGEFQFHNGRDCIKFRFHLKNLLDNFKDHFDIKKY